MADLAAWLLEQTAAIEQHAELIHSLNCGGFMHNEQGLHEELCDCGEPARVLAECALKRTIIEAWVAADAAAKQLTGDAGVMADTTAAALQTVTELFAELYADRPGFDPAWRLEQHTS